MNYKDLYTYEYQMGEHTSSVEGVVIAMGNKDEIDLEKFHTTGAGAAMAEMMENVVLNPDEHSPASIAYWAKKGMVKEFHGEDVPMDWADYEKRTGFHYDVEHAYPQNLWKKWTSFVPVSAFKPENKDRKYPLMFVFHGNSNPIYTIDGWGYVTPAAEKEFIVIVPTLEFEEVIFEILEEAKRLYPVDESRIYVTGFSYGSKNTNILALQHPEVFAAAAPCGGFMTDGRESPEPRPVRNVPVPKVKLDEPRFTYDGYQSKVGKYRMPIMTVIGNKDMQPWPINKIPFREVRLGWLNFWLERNGMATIPNEALDHLEHGTIAEQMIGLPLAPGCGKMLTADGIDYAIADFKDAEGVTYIKLICEDNMPHWPTPELGRQVVEFFSHFSRDPETHKSVYTK